MVERFVLLHKDFQTRATLSCEHDDKLHILVACSHHGRDGTTFAVAANAETSRVDMGIVL